MKNQALLSSKDKSKIIKCRLLQFLFGALRVTLLPLSSGTMFVNMCLLLKQAMNYRCDKACSFVVYDKLVPRIV